ncbi:MAG: MarR family transcriptional regulator [Candidatus Accumulibacter sp.]|jgi:DNA-binding MarR family transcriptional regulator|nr:MarR family transcriptional regulator [Accumulibacter sp.]
MTNENSITLATTITGEALLGLFRRALKSMSRSRHNRGNTQHAQTHVLAILKEKEPMSQRDLMEMLDVRSASLSEILEKLEQNGFITRERSDQDKRNFTISATEQGRAMVEEHKKEHLKNAEAIFTPLSEVERQQLGELLEKIVTSLEKDDSGHDVEHEHGFGHRSGRGHHEGDEEHDHHGHEHHGHGHRGASRQEQHGPNAHDPRHSGNE